MNAFEKAVQFIEQQIAREGGPPQAINLTKYRSRANFRRLRPGEDYDECETLRAWCMLRDIDVIDVPAGDDPSPVNRARNAAQPPYRLGIVMGRGTGTASIGYMMVYLGGERKNEGGEL